MPSDPKAMSTYYSVQVFDAAPSDAPPSNSALPLKTWRGQGTFQGWNGDTNNPQLVSFEIPAAQKDVNFPGVTPTYPKYTPNPTVAKGATPTGFTSNQIAPWLSTKEQAQLFASLIPNSSYAEAYVGQINYGTETRRVYQITYPNGLKTTAGELISEEFKDGAGRPGHWDIGSGGLIWVSDPLSTGKVSAAPSVPIPLNLPSGAKLVSVMTGPGITTVQVRLAGGGSLTLTISGSGFPDVDGTYTRVGP